MQRQASWPVQKGGQFSVVSPEHLDRRCCGTVIQFFQQLTILCQEESKLGKMKELKRAMSIGLALIACSNMTLAGTGGRLLGETVITAFAEDTATPVQINRSYLLMGETIEVNCQEGLTLKYFKGDEYIGEGPITMGYDLCEKWLRVEAYSDDTLVGEDKIYCSNLPVIYIDTKDGAMPPPDDK